MFKSAANKTTDLTKKGMEKIQEATTKKKGKSKEDEEEEKTPE